MPSVKSLLNPPRYVYRKLRRALGNLRFPQVIKAVQKAPLQISPEPLWKLTSRGFNGLISPIQRKDEIVPLLRLLQKMQPKVVMEIGTAQGGTLFMFTRVADPNARLLSLDLPNGPGGGGYPPKRIPLYQAFALPTQKLELFRDNSHDPAVLAKVKAWLGNERIDFLFIDGDHSYEGVKQDFEMYGPLVRPGGVMAFHDIVYCPEVTRLWDEIKGGYAVEELVAKQAPFGIGIVHTKA